VILIGVGANLPHPRFGPPRATCGAALASLAEAASVAVAGRSRWYRSAPVPVSDQPWFVNAVVRLETALDPAGLMALLSATEQAFGRRRDEPNAARTLDLDLLAYGDLVSGEAAPAAPGAGQRPAVTLPHPRLHQRAFVLLPLRDVAPGWRHPVTGAGVKALIAALPPGQTAEVMADVAGAFGSEWKAPPRPAGPEYWAP
jgi:2-amino-4-hydroxy-6-hydroxymethyldihydropteridine diphosphokinase